MSLRTLRVCLAQPEQLYRTFAASTPASDGAPVPEWAELYSVSAPRDGYLCAGDQCLAVRRVDTQELLSVAYVAAVPHASESVVYELQLDEASGCAAGRLVPVCTVDQLRADDGNDDADAWPVDERRFAMLGGDEARALVLARYADASRLQAMLRVYERTCALLAHRPWLLYFEGFIDVQGLDRALDDTPALRRRLHAALGQARPSAAQWWVPLAQRYYQLHCALANGGGAVARVDAPPGDTMAASLRALDVVTPVRDMPDALAALLHARAPQQLTALLQRLSWLGRHTDTEVAAADGSLCTALLHNDVLLVDSGALPDDVVRAPECEQVYARAWLRLETPGVRSVQALREQLANSANADADEPAPLPLLYVAHLERWSAYDLLAALTTALHWSGHRRRADDGFYERTGSAVPFKLVLVHSSREPASRLVHSLLEHRDGGVRLPRHVVQHHIAAPRGDKSPLMQALLHAQDTATDYWPRMLQLLRSYSDERVLVDDCDSPSLMLVPRSLAGSVQITYDADDPRDIGAVGSLCIAADTADAYATLRRAESTSPSKFGALYISVDCSRAHPSPQLLYALCRRYALVCLVSE